MSVELKRGTIAKYGLLPAHTSPVVPGFEMRSYPHIGFTILTTTVRADFLTATTNQSANERSCSSLN